MQFQNTAANHRVEKNGGILTRAISFYKATSLWENFLRGKRHCGFKDNYIIKLELSSTSFAFREIANLCFSVNEEGKKKSSIAVF